jgi:hypothetical protein
MVQSRQLEIANPIHTFETNQYRKAWTLAVKDSANVLVYLGLCSQENAQKVIKQTLASVN